jgi:hypothetical protein
MSRGTGDLADAPAPADGEGRDRRDLLEEIASLEAQNRKLRADAARRRQRPYRSTALGLSGVALLAVAGAVFFPAVRDVLLALAGTGAFAAALSYFVTMERFVPFTTARRFYDAFAANVEALARQLDVSASRVYLPTADPRGVRLYIPQYSDYLVPSGSELDAPLVVAEEERKRGLSLVPVGARLFDEFEDASSEPLASAPERLSSQLCDGLTNTFEFASRAEATADDERGTASFGVVSPVWDDFDRVDHPVTSFLGVGLAVGLGEAVELSVESEADGEYDARIAVELADTDS